MSRETLKKSIPSGPRRRRTDDVPGVQDEEKFRLLVGSVRDYAIFLLDRDGVVESWNEGAERLKGYSAAEIVGKHFSTFYTPEDLARDHPADELRIARAEGRYEEEGWRIRKDGTRFWANVIITALRGDGGEVIGFAKVTRDLTERRQADETLRLALENMERSVDERTGELSAVNQKLREAVRVRDEFLSIASHELRTPLTPLKLQIQLLAHQVRSRALFSLPEERIVRMADTCERSIARLSALVDNLLDVSRLETGRLRLDPARADLAAILRELIDRYGDEIRVSGSAVRVEAPPELWGTFDALRIEQVFTNLLSNALKYGQGGAIDISLATVGDRAVLRVRDRGIGIDAKDHARVFDRFERVDAEGSIGGLGLGLYISRQIVQAHGGSIRVENAPDRGSVFAVALPLGSGA